MVRTVLIAVVAAALAVYSTGPARAADHDHSSTGPHGGDVLELGVDEYHAELVLDEKQDVVTVYILDSTAKQEAPIDASALNVNLRLSGKPVQFQLAAVKSKDASDGTATCFRAKNPQLMKALHVPNANPRLTVRIGKKSYVARVAHRHKR